MLGAPRVDRAPVRVLLSGVVTALAWVLVASGSARAESGASWADEPDGPGVAIDASRIEVDAVLDSGDSYDLPPITVRNPGSTRAGYVMAGSAVRGDAAPVDPEWLVFSPEEFELAPGSTQVVNVSLAIPQDAVPGDYEGLLLASLQSEGDGATVGAGAGTLLTFTVRDYGGLNVPAWVSWATGAAALLILAAWLVVRTARRYEVVVRRRED